MFEELVSAFLHLLRPLWSLFLAEQNREETPPAQGWGMLRCSRTPPGLVFPCSGAHGAASFSVVLRDCWQRGQGEGLFGYGAPVQSVRAFRFFLFMCVFCIINSDLVCPRSLCI